MSPGNPSIWNDLLSDPLPPLPGPRRKGARSRADVPPQVLADLNAGRIETVTLSEWLAIDLPALVLAALKSVGLKSQARELAARARARVDTPPASRGKAVGVDLCALVRQHADGGRLARQLADHPSDVVRSWVAYAVAADDSLDLASRLSVARRFAADRNMAVREAAWDSIRPFLALDLDRGIELLKPWVTDADANIRRCAVEATRPRGVWTSHLKQLRDDPKPGLVLLEPVRADASRYVQTAAANWLNDASKDHPKWVTSVCRRWSKESASPHTGWLVNHALRTLRKQGLAPAK